MLHLKIPGSDTMTLEHLLLDYNGTLAVDGTLIEGVMERLEALSHHLKIHVLTADTYGSVQNQCDAPFIHVHVIGTENQDREKLAYLQQLGPKVTVAAGNGRNDALMLCEAALGVAVIQDEGASMKSVMAADLVFNSVEALLDALLQPKRLVATLRN